MQPDSRCSFDAHETCAAFYYSVLISLFAKGPVMVSVHIWGMKDTLEVHFLSKLDVFANPESETKMGREGYCNV